MSSDGIETEYYTRRLQMSLDMAAHAVTACAMLAHQGLAACYRAKLASLHSVEAPRAVLSLASYRQQRQVNDFPFDQAMPSICMSVAGR